MTFNIRYDTDDDGSNEWKYRKDKVISQILFHNVHVLGIQEGLSNQVQDLRKGLSGYDFVGVGRGGNKKGEYSAIFYDKSRLTLLQSQTFWLSEHPARIGKKGWDANFPRIVTWAKFRDRKNKNNFYVFNTHFDNDGAVARRESSKLLLLKVRQIAGKVSCIITGDFNSIPTDEPIQVLTDINSPDRFLDTKTISELPHFGPKGTFNEFSSKAISDQPIDYIFTKSGVRVLRHATFSESWEGQFSSDHFPVSATVIIK